MLAEVAPWPRRRGITWSSGWAHEVDVIAMRPLNCSFLTDPDTTAQLIEIVQSAGVLTALAVEHENDRGLTTP